MLKKFVNWFDRLGDLPLCPYCFNTIQLKETPFRCMNEARLCPPERDELLARVWRDNVPRGKVVPANVPANALKIGLLPANAGKSGRCQSCGMETSKRLCPHCHMDLPGNFGEDRSLILSVIGAKDAGKSHYIAVLIESLKKSVAPRLQASFNFVNEATNRRYKRYFYDELYTYGRLLQPTRAASSEDNSVSLPLVYRLYFQEGSGIGTVVSLVFFDTAGEDLNDQDQMSVLNKYIYKSDGIVLLVDPLQLEEVRQGLDGQSILPDRNTEAADIVTRVTNLIRAGRKLRERDKIPTPFAIAFSKVDALEPLLGPQAQIYASANHRNGFDMADFNAVGSEVASLLERWQEGHLTNEVRTHYSHFGFFGLSSLGAVPVPHGRIPSVKPHRVEDPILWLLNHHGLIPGYH